MEKEKKVPIKFGISQNFDCSYLPGQQEKLLIAVDQLIYSPPNYEQLMQIGFRRSGSQVYRPYCETCQACQSLRVLADEFKPSRSQKRLLKKSADLKVQLQLAQQDPYQYYPLYEKYINLRHQDGSMYPANIEQFNSFIEAQWLNVGFLEIYDGDKLISVSVIDVLPEALSAVYTFFDPDYEQLSLGSVAIIKSIAFAKQMQLPHVYLGYQIDDCKKMNYKNKYKPYEALIGGHWERSDKTE